MRLGHRHQCDQCGQVAPRDENWRRYSSIDHDETCPELMPELCSEVCRVKFIERLKQGEVSLPKLSNHKYYCTVRLAGKGYGLFASAARAAGRK